MTVQNFGKFHQKFTNKRKHYDSRNPTDCCLTSYLKFVGGTPPPPLSLRTKTPHFRPRAGHALRLLREILESGDTAATAALAQPGVFRAVAARIPAACQGDDGAGAAQSAMLLLQHLLSSMQVPGEGSDGPTALCCSFLAIQAAVRVLQSQDLAQPAVDAADTLLQTAAGAVCGTVAESGEEEASPEELIAVQELCSVVRRARAQLAVQEAAINTVVACGQVS